MSTPRPGHASTARLSYVVEALSEPLQVHRTSGAQ